jgi:hypothetical protein
MHGILKKIWNQLSGTLPGPKAGLSFPAADSPLDHSADKSTAGVSVICPFNSREKLERYLLPSITSQRAPHELLLIDNTRGHHPSAAQVLNRTARQAVYDHLLFVHQDVSLDHPNWLTDALEELSTLKRLGAAGVAGRNRKGMVSSVYSGFPRRLVGEGWKPSVPVRVQTLDGCLLLVSRKLFLKFPFDESATDGWYLFVANYCLDLARMGHRSYVLTQGVFHESLGPANLSVLENSRARIVARHRDHIRTLYTTVGIWDTSR